MNLLQRTRTDAGIAGIHKYPYRPAACRFCSVFARISRSTTVQSDGREATLASQSAQSFSSARQAHLQKPDTADLRQGIRRTAGIARAAQDGRTKQGIPPMRFRFLALILLAAVPLTSAAQDFHAAPVANHIEEISGLANYPMNRYSPGICCTFPLPITPISRTPIESHRTAPSTSGPERASQHYWPYSALVEKAISKALLGAKTPGQTDRIRLRSRVPKQTGPDLGRSQTSTDNSGPWEYASAGCSGQMRWPRKRCGFEILVLQPAAPVRHSRSSIFPCRP